MKKLPLFSIALLSAGVLSAPASDAEDYKILADYKILKVLDSGVPEDEVWPQSVSFSPDGRTLASGGGPVLQLWDVASGEEKARLQSSYEGEPGSIGSVSFSPDGQTVAFGAQVEDSRYFGFWDLVSGEETLLGGTGGFEGGWMSGGAPPLVSFSPDGQVLVHVERYSIGLWDMTTDYTSLGRWDYTDLEPPDTGNFDTAGLSFSPDGQTLAVSDEYGNGVVWLYEMPGGVFKATLETNSRGSVSAVSFSPDGETLASAGEDDTILLWDMAGGEVKAVFKADAAVSAMSFSPDGHLASGRPDGAILLWDVDSGEVKAFLEGHSSDGVTDVSFSPDGRILASGGRDGMVLLFDPFFTPLLTVTKISGDEQQGLPGAVLADSLAVSVRDEEGNGIAGVTVQFAVTAGGGTLSENTLTTDAGGRAAVLLTLGSEPGTHTVIAVADGLEPVTFTATAAAEVSTDFDGDEATTLIDFFLFADAFGGNDPRFDLDGSGTVDFWDFFIFADHFADSEARGKLLALAREMIGLPDGPGLQQNHPNPFNSETVISWIQLRDGPARVELYALTGQRVAVLHQGPNKAGVRQVHWDGRDDRGRPLASGVYLYRLVTEESDYTRKLTMLR